LELQNAIHQGVLSLFDSLYGPRSRQGTALETSLRDVQKSGHPANANIISYSIGILRGALTNLQQELAVGLVGSIRAAVTGEVLSDFLLLAKEALVEPGDAPKNVAAVLAAAAYEDVLRRLASVDSSAPSEKLADVITALKDRGLLKGSQVGIAQSYLNLRNCALHAQWDKVDRPGVQSVIAFTEQLLLTHFV
jgi:hypothetical protein